MAILFRTCSPPFYESRKICSHHMNEFCPPQLTGELSRVFLLHNNRPALKLGKRNSNFKSDVKSRRRAVCSLMNTSEGRATTADLCLFPFTSMPLPTSSGGLRLYEPKYVHMLEVITDVAQEAGTVPRFGAITREASKISTGSVISEHAAIGCCCTVENSGTAPDGTIWVQYNGFRRFRILAMQRTMPFQVATVEWLDDNVPDQPGASSGARVDRLEREVWEMCCQVASLTASLDARSSTMAFPDAFQKLPSSLRNFSPVPPVLAPVGGGITRVGKADIEVWRQSSQNKEDLWASQRGSNPYWAARERLAKPARQEAFSFAAASMVDLGHEERMSVLLIQDTGARLAWVQEAIGPHLAALHGKRALLAATENM